MCKSWCQPFNLGAHHYFDFKGHGSWVEFLAASCFVFVCLFVFQLPRWVIILFLSLTSGWGFLVFVLFCFGFLYCFLFLFVCLFVCLFCFVLFFLQNVQFPHHIYGVRLSFFVFVLFCFVLFFLSRRLVKFFAFFYFCLFVFILFCFVLFCFCFKKFHPFDIKWCALTLILLYRWWWTLRHRQFWIPMQFSENLIPIWNFTNTFIQECKIIWEFQIRSGGTSLLRPLWRSWRYLKAYLLMSNSGHFQNFKKLIFFFSYFRSPPLRRTIPKRN